MRAGQKNKTWKKMESRGQNDRNDKYVKQIGIRGSRCLSAIDTNKGYDKNTIMKNCSKLNVFERCDIGSISFKEKIGFSKQIEQCRIDREMQIQGKQGNGLLVMKNKFVSLFDLYLQQEIIKHYCSKSNWKFDKNLIDTKILPTLDLLSVGKKGFKYRFEPFLEKISEKYLLKSQADIYSRMCSKDLLMQIVEKWLRIKQGQISLKRCIRENISQFNRYYCCDNLKIDRKKMFDLLFRDSLDLKMVNVIKMSLFIFKAQGENQDKSFGDWLEEY